MFIPRGNLVYENLATSYVLVDALVADLCEGGFSGAVELILFNADGYVVIDRGKVVAVVEKTGDGEFSSATVNELSSKSRRERGRISVFTYPPGLGSALAGRLAAIPLYSQLSTEFADLGRMIAKLGRESDRRWFVELIIADEHNALICVSGDELIVVSPDQFSIDHAGSRSQLGSLVERSEKEGGVFDVYFSTLGSQEPSVPDTGSHEVYSMVDSPELVDDEPVAATTDLPPDESNHSHAPAHQSGYAPPTAMAVYPEMIPSPNDEHPEESVADEKGATAVGDELSLGSLVMLVGNSTRDEVMAEVKRLMSEIARTIEDTAQSVDPRDSFAMHLRAGQLKIAEEFPFLDPFGAEFEYLGGEIAFIGRVEPEEFVRGLTDALRLAVSSLADSTTEGWRFRGLLAQELGRLLEAQRASLTSYALDESIQRILAS
jgi:hypothetical protein